jgi:hypothetical protein
MPVVLATQEDCGSKPAWTNTSQTAYLKKTHHKKGLVGWLMVQALSSKPILEKKKKKKERNQSE